MSNRPFRAAGSAGLLRRAAGLFVATAAVLALASLLSAFGTASVTPAEPRPAQDCEADGPPDARCLTHLEPRSLFESASAVLSPDGRRFVYQVREGRSVQLWLFDRRTGQSERLTRGPGKRYGPVWSSDGTRVAFRGEVPDAFGDMARGIGIVDVRTEQERLIFRTSPGVTIRSHTWTPDDRILFERTWLTLGTTSPPETDASGSGRNSEVWIVNADGLAAEPFPSVPTGRTRLAFSPDGRRTAWTGSGCRSDVENRPGLFVGDRDARNGRCVVALQRVPDHFAWAADGETVYYVGPTGEREATALYAVSAAGDGEARRIPSPPGRITGLGVSRTGEIGLAVHRSDMAIATLPAEGGAPDRIPLPDSLHGFWPVWHPDGDRIAFTASSLDPGDPWGDAELAVVETDRAGRDVDLVRPGSADEAKVLAGTWSPDGRYFASYRREQRRGRFHLGPGDRIDASIADLGTADWRFVPGPPTWSPGGEKIALAPGSALYYRAEDSNYLPRQGVVTVAVDSAVLAGGYPRHHDRSSLELAGFDGVAQQPRYAPDGARVAFARRIQIGESPGIHVVPADGGSVETVAEFRGGETFSGPEWSPDGRWLLYASPGDDGVWRIRRTDPETGSVETLTRGPEHALHPRLSPDGRTLAVTLWDSSTELWSLPSRTPEVALPPVDTAPTIHAVPPVSASRVDSGLLELVARAESAPGVPELWPGFWDGEHSYVVRTADEPFEALAVNAGPTPAGYRPVAEEGLARQLRDRLHHARGRSADVGWLDMDVPVIAFDRDSLDDEAMRAPNLYELYTGVFRDLDAGHLERIEHEGLSGSCRQAACPTPDDRSCAALVHAEHTILRQSLRLLPRRSDEATEEIRRRMRGYAALLWLRNLGGSRELRIQRMRGIPGYVAGQATTLAMGQTLTDRHPALTSRLEVTAPASGDLMDEDDRAMVSGLSVAVLLDRLHPGWREEVRDGASLLETLFRATHLTETDALPVAVAAMRERGFWRILNQIRSVQAADTVDTYVPWRGERDRSLEAGFFTGAMCHVTPDAREVRIDLGGFPARGERNFSFRWDVGPDGASTPLDGYAFVMDPVEVELEIEGLRVLVRHRPVALYDGGLTIYPSREIADEITEPAGRDSSSTRHVRAGGIEFEIGPGIGVDVYISRIRVAP